MVNSIGANIFRSVIWGGFLPKVRHFLNSMEREFSSAVRQGPITGHLPSSSRRSAALSETKCRVLVLPTFRVSADQGMVS